MSLEQAIKNGLQSIIDCPNSNCQSCHESAQETLFFFTEAMKYLEKRITIGEYELNWRDKTLELTKGEETLVLEKEIITEILDKIFQDKI